MHPINQIINNIGQCEIEEIHEDNPNNNILLGIAQQNLIKDQKLEEKNQKYEKQIRLLVQENDGLKDQNLLLKEKITTLESKLTDKDEQFQIEKEMFNKTIKEKENKNLELEQKLKPDAEKYQALAKHITELEKILLQLDSDFCKSYSGFVSISQVILAPTRLNYFKTCVPNVYNQIMEYANKKPILDNYKTALNLMDGLKK